MAEMILGIDFDNTIINYNQLFYDLAEQKGWLEISVLPRKQKVRDHVRALAGGEQKWQYLQAMAYGDFIHSALLESGFISFLHWCEQQQIPYYIVSHKTVFATACPDGANLQECARDWLRTNVFTSEKKITATVAQVFFEPTRELKIQRLKDLNCTHFIDDLEELFADPTFPSQVKQILFSGDSPKDYSGLVCSSWQEIHQLLRESHGTA